MLNEQFLQISQKEQEVLSTYFLNKMSNHLKPIPLHTGKFFDGELEINVALPSSVNSDVLYHWLEDVGR